MKRADSGGHTTRFWLGCALSAAGAVTWAPSTRAQSSPLPVRPGLATRAPEALQRSGGIVVYPVVSVRSGNSTVYYSIYGLKIWVTGPVGLNPLAP